MCFVYIWPYQVKSARLTELRNASDCIHLRLQKFLMWLVTNLWWYIYSECPHEALEPVSTLIFAAARYPDLPELCDLRHVFTERYGASIEPFVSSEVHITLSLFVFELLPFVAPCWLTWQFCGQFVQKLQNKSFTKEEKLLVMQDIIEEFALPFNIKEIERKISGVPQNKKVLHILVNLLDCIIQSF
jgi:hypothetical protein